MPLFGIVVKAFFGFWVDEFVMAQGREILVLGTGAKIDVMLIVEIFPM